MATAAARKNDWRNWSMKFKGWCAVACDNGLSYEPTIWGDDYVLWFGEFKDEWVVRILRNDIHDFDYELDDLGSVNISNTGPGEAPSAMDVVRDLRSSYGLDMDPIMVPLTLVTELFETLGWEVGS